MPRPDSNEHKPYFGNYINLVREHDVLDALETNYEDLADFLEPIPHEKASFSYEAGKWTLAQVLQHMIDTERVFAHRAFWIARGGSQPLPGFEQDDFAANAGHPELSLVEVCLDLLSLRLSTMNLFKSFGRDDLIKTALLESQNLSVNAAGFIIAGHSIHHMNVIAEKYLNT